MARAIAVPAAPVKDGAQWELAAQWAQGWRVVKWLVSPLIVVSFLVVIGQGFLFYRLFDDMHPVLGYAYVAMLAGLLAVLVGRPLAAFLTMPVAATSPRTMTVSSMPSSRKSMTARTSRPDAEGHSDNGGRR